MVQCGQRRNRAKRRHTLGQDIRTPLPRTVRLRSAPERDLPPFGFTCHDISRGFLRIALGCGEPSARAPCRPSATGTLPRIGTNGVARASIVGTAVVEQEQTMNIHCNRLQMLLFKLLICLCYPVVPWPRLSSGWNSSVARRGADPRVGTTPLPGLGNVNGDRRSFGVC